MSVAANIARIREILAERPVKLIAVTKAASLSQIEEAWNCGVTEFGENRVQEALKKRQALAPSLVQNSNWHFIGHLQTNKVKQVVGQFALIHSVDSLHLAQELSKTAAQKGIRQNVLLQVKILPDPDKSGFTEAELKSKMADLIALPGINIQGLMTITPISDDPEVGRACFNGLARLKSELEDAHGIKLSDLSMGMTNDWQEALDCGSTMIRIGRAIFAEAS